jgi:hypothetical protein
LYTKDKSNAGKIFFSIEGERTGAVNAAVVIVAVVAVLQGG